MKHIQELLKKFKEYEDNPNYSYEEQEVVFDELISAIKAKFGNDGIKLIEVAIHGGCEFYDFATDDKGSMDHLMDN